MRRLVGVLSLAIAVALTVGLVILVFQSITGDFTGGELQIVWTITGFVGILTALAWAAAVAILKPASRSPAYRAVFGGLLAGLVLAFVVHPWALLAVPIVGFALWQRDARRAGVDPADSADLG